jgi:preprotein translocase subunit SecF
LGGRGRQISEFEASLVYRVTSSTARATQRNPVSKNKNKKQKTTTKKKKKKKKRKIGTNSSLKLWYNSVLRLYGPGFLVVVVVVA